MDENKENLKNKSESGYGTYITNEQLNNIDELLSKINSQEIMSSTKNNMETLKTLKKEVKSSNPAQTNQNIKI